MYRQKQPWEMFPILRIAVKYSRSRYQLVIESFEALEIGQIYYIRSDCGHSGKQGYDKG